MGGGFGGCTLNIVKDGMTESFIEKISEDYRQSFGHDLNAYIVNTSDGTEQIN
jgi:galactokinase